MSDSNILVLCLACLSIGFVIGFLVGMMVGDSKSDPS